jgi:6-oxo-cyclohex-1-ene-carbonyl-CoA hydrolase
LNDLAPVHRTPEGVFVANPLVETERAFDGEGRPVFGEPKVGDALARGKELAARCTIDLSRLDAAVDRLVTKLLYTFPDCTRKTLESLRKKKLEHWLQNSEQNRSWLSLNMNTEAAAGFPAFHFGNRDEREIDFARLRRLVAEGARFDDALVREVLKPSARAGREAPSGER